MHALLDGRQTVLLRKGGIGEKRFEVAAHEFLLFPTVAHSHAERVRPEHRDLLGPAAADSTDECVLLRAAAKVVAALPVNRPEGLDAIEDLHIWTAESVRADRLDFRPKHKLAVLVVCAIPLAEPVRLARRPEYGGCTSWVQLPVTPTLAAPVHDEAALAEVAARVREVAGDLPPGRWSALLVGAWWPARPDAPMAGVTYWRKAAQLKRNEANDLRNERSLLAVNQGRTADDLLERYWRGEQRLATIAHQCEVKSDQSEQVADTVNYLRDRLTEIAQSGNQQINQILAGKGPIEAKVAAVNAVIEQSNAMADHVGATAMSNIIDATQRVFDETIGGDAHTWLRDHWTSGRYRRRSIRAVCIAVRGRGRCWLRPRPGTGWPWSWGWLRPVMRR